MAGGCTATRRLASLGFNLHVIGRIGSGTVIIIHSNHALNINTNRVGHVNSTRVTLGRTRTTNIGRNLILTSSTFFPFSSYMAVTRRVNIATVIRPNNDIHSRSSVHGTSRYNVTVLFANVHRFGRWSYIVGLVILG